MAHVVAQNLPDGAHRFLCKHCGESYDPVLPCPVYIFVAIMEAFGEEHSDCEPKVESDRITDRDEDLSAESDG